MSMVTDAGMNSPEVTKLAGAMLRVQEALHPALRDGRNGYTNSRYASLQSVMEACRQALLQNGIWLTQFPVPVESGCLGLVTKLVRAESGQWQSSLLVMPLPKGDPQGYGAAMTYARRYGLAAMVGVVTEAEDIGSALPSPKSNTYPASRSIDSNSHLHDANTKPNAGEVSFAHLPRLDGIQYQKGTAPNGQQCVVAIGDTLRHKDQLRGAGFLWDVHRKLWWRQPRAA